MMHVILKKDKSAILNIDSPFKILELTIHRKDNQKPLPQVKIYFSNSEEELDELNFLSKGDFSIFLKAMPQSSVSYKGDAASQIKNIYKYAKVTFSSPLNIEENLDCYYELIK